MCLRKYVVVLKRKVKRNIMLYMKNLTFQIDTEMNTNLIRKKREFIINLRGNDFILKHAAADFFDKIKSHDRRKSI